MEYQTQMSYSPDSCSIGVACPLRIFVVEDSRAVRDLLCEQLNDIPNATVVGTADSEQTALQGLDHTPCDVLIIDIQLRTGNGIGVLRALHTTHADRRALPRRVVFSNYTEDEYRRLASRYGAHDFFDKATDFTALLQLIGTLADESR